MKKTLLLAMVLFLMGITKTVSAVEFGKLAKDLMFKLDKTDKHNPTAGYVVDWQAVGNIKYIKYNKKDFASEYRGSIKDSITFAGKKTINAHTKNKSAEWYFTATGSRAGISTYELSASLNDSPEDGALLESLSKFGVSAKLLICNHDDKSISEYDTIKEARFYKLKSNGYADATMIVSDDYAAQFITKKITLTPNTTELSGNCR